MTSTPSQYPLASTFQLLSTKQLLDAIRAATAEIADRTGHTAVTTSLAAVIDEVDDLETLLAALPPTAPICRETAMAHFGGSI